MLKKLVFGYFYLTTAVGVGLFALIAYGKIGKAGGGNYQPLPWIWLIMCAAIYCFARFYVLKKAAHPSDFDVMSPQMQKSVYPVIAYGMLVLEPTLGIILGLVTLLHSSATI